MSEETRITDPATGGQKGQKLERFDLVPFEPLEELARLYGVGATKYEDDNWRKGYRWRLSIGAMLRHISKFVLGHSYDTIDGKQDGPKEAGVHTGCHHLACAAWHCFTLYTFDTQGLGTDDRAKGKGQTAKPALVASSEIQKDAKIPAFLSRWACNGSPNFTVKVKGVNDGYVYFFIEGGSRGHCKPLADFLARYTEIN